MSMSQNRLHHQRRVLSHMGIDIWVTSRTQVEVDQSAEQFWRDQISESISLDEQLPISLPQEKAPIAAEKLVEPLPSQVKRTPQPSSNTTEVQHTADHLLPDDHTLSLHSAIETFQLIAIHTQKVTILVNATVLSDDENLLLNNITSSIDANQYRLKWPFAIAVALEQQAIHANMYVKGFLDSLGNQHYLLLGELPKGITLNIKQDLKMNSLQEMLDHPEYKRTLWDALKRI